MERRYRITAHRGLSPSRTLGLEPENTLLAFREALALGVDGCECDLRVTADGQGVILHDATVDRTTDGAGEVAAMTFDDLRRLDAGKGELVPTLAEAANLICPQALLRLELKAPNTPALAVKVLGELCFSDRVVYSSFDPALLTKVRALQPQARLRFIFGKPDAERMARVRELGLEGFDVEYHFISPDLIARYHREGLSIAAWTPDDPDEMRRLITLGIDEIITNRPDVLFDVLSGEK